MTLTLHIDGIEAHSWTVSTWQTEKQCIALARSAGLVWRMQGRVCLFYHQVMSKGTPDTTTYSNQRAVCTEVSK